MEVRQLLSAVTWNHRNGTLTVIGTSAADSIEAVYSKGAIELLVNGNLQATGIPISSVTRIVVYGREGSDDISIDPSVGPITVTMHGGSGDDKLQGGSGMGTFHSGPGADLVIGGPLNDVIYGDSGTSRTDGNRDTIKAGPGNDKIYGDEFDVVQGEVGLDTFIAVTTSGALNFDMFESSVETLRGSQFSDYISAVRATYNVTVYAGSGDDTVIGGSGNDVLRGDAGADSIRGGFGNDQIYAGISAAESDAFIDQLHGEAGTDTLYFQSLDFVDGGEGTDRARSTIDSPAVTINLLASRLEVVDGTSWNDVLDATGVSVPVTLRGMAGNDILRGGSGNDFIVGGVGVDILYGGAGIDQLYSNQKGESDRESDTLFPGTSLNGKAEVVDLGAGDISPSSLSTIELSDIANVTTETAPDTIFKKLVVTDADIPLGDQVMTTMSASGLFELVGSYIRTRRTLALADVGLHSVVFVATDEAGKTATRTFAVQVNLTPETLIAAQQQNEAVGITDALDRINEQARQSLLITLLDMEIEESAELVSLGRCLGAKNAAITETIVKRIEAITQRINAIKSSITSINYLLTDFDNPVVVDSPFRLFESTTLLLSDLLFASEFEGETFDDVIILANTLHDRWSLEHQQGLTAAQELRDRNAVLLRGTAALDRLRHRFQSIDRPSPSEASILKCLPYISQKMVIALEHWGDARQSVLTTSRVEDDLLDQLETAWETPGTSSAVALPALGGVTEIKSWPGQMNNAGSLSMREGSLVSHGTALTIDLVKSVHFVDRVSLKVRSDNPDVPVPVRFYRDTQLIGIINATPGEVEDFSDTAGITSVLLANHVRPMSQRAKDFLDYYNSRDGQFYEIYAAQRGGSGGAAARFFFNNPTIPISERSSIVAEATQGVRPYDISLDKLVVGGTSLVSQFPAASISLANIPALSLAAHPAWNQSDDTLRRGPSPGYLAVGRYAPNAYGVRRDINQYSAVTLTGLNGPVVPTNVARHVPGGDVPLEPAYWEIIGNTVILRPGAPEQVVIYLGTPDGRDPQGRNFDVRHVQKLTAEGLVPPEIMTIRTDILAIRSPNFSEGIGPALTEIKDLGRVVTIDQGNVLINVWNDGRQGGVVRLVTNPGSPQAREVSFSIGGNEGRSISTRFSVPADGLLRIRVILPDGRIIDNGRLLKTQGDSDERRIAVKQPDGTYRLQFVSVDSPLPIISDAPGYDPGFAAWMAARIAEGKTEYGDPANFANVFVEYLEEKVANDKTPLAPEMQWNRALVASLHESATYGKIRRIELDQLGSEHSFDAFLREFDLNSAIQRQQLMSAVDYVVRLNASTTAGVLTEATRDSVVDAVGRHFKLGIRGLETADDLVTLLRPHINFSDSFTSKHLLLQIAVDLSFQSYFGVHVEKSLLESVSTEASLAVASFGVSWGLKRLGIATIPSGQILLAATTAYSFWQHYDAYQTEPFLISYGGEVAMVSRTIADELDAVLLNNFLRPDLRKTTERILQLYDASRSYLLERMPASMASDQSAMAVIERQAKFFDRVIDSLTIWI